MAGEAGESNFPLSLTSSEVHYKSYFSHELLHTVLKVGGKSNSELCGSKSELKKLRFAELSLA